MTERTTNPYLFLWLVLAIALAVVAAPLLIAAVVNWMRDPEWWRPFIVAMLNIVPGAVLLATAVYILAEVIRW